MQDYILSMKLCVKDDAIEELKKAVDHGIGTLLNLEEWPEITGVWDARLDKLEDVTINCRRMVGNN